MVLELAGVINPSAEGLRSTTRVPLELLQITLDLGVRAPRQNYIGTNATLF